MPKTARFLIFLIVAASIYVTGVSNEVYILASPQSLAFHTALRKAESIVAFSVFAATLAWWLWPKPLHSTRNRRGLGFVLVVTTAAFSALIEVGQRVSGSTESYAESLFDVGCGALGGYIVATLIALAERRRSRTDRTR